MGLDDAAPMAPWLRTWGFAGLAFASGLFVGNNWQKAPIIPEQTVPVSPLPVRHNEPVAASATELPATKNLQIDNASTIERLQALTWFKNNGFKYLSVDVFDFKGLDPTFAKLFDLTETEKQTLNTAIAKAKQRSIEIAKQAARVTSASDADTLVIEIPEQAKLGGQIYDDLLGAFRNVLGPDKFAYFDSFAGQGFGRQFNSFGAQKAKFVIGKIPSTNSDPNYSIKKTYKDFATDTNGTVTGTMNMGSIVSSYPEIATIIPPEFKAKPTR